MIDAPQPELVARHRMPSELVQRPLEAGLVRIERRLLAEERADVR